ncbi:hypothetical protein PT7_2022 [Pusillimonas sp. T7-7]|uniref:hypothetical protein n=1 Tax=Pusillimonas sp. (strain T7-7) TaxID=1007105 RepID=UPI0002084CC0|nr:hypothetical protein [Pusillimonas sp. T7-7]AEC20562.1 hypothetical protein PT7_2022 [Pusillimonas sp. T7-7]
MSTEETSPLVFTDEELDLLGRTADALSAYMGKPVLAEIMNAEDTGFEWVIFAVPLDVQDDPDDYILVQIGGVDARYVGNTGGMTISDGEVYDCEYLWAIQLSDLEGVRYIKVDQEGDEVAWADKLQDILPFIMKDETVSSDDDDRDDDEDTPDLDDSGEPRILH